MADDRHIEPDPSDTKTSSKRPYESPVLTRYGTIDELVDSGVVGSAPSITLIGTA
jgi:hypothetical protein